MNIYRIITPGIPQFNYGPFGVAIFFIISGFVVSFSLKSKERVPFIKERLMRIYPTYIASVFIMIIVLYSTSIFFWSNKPSLKISEIIFNVALINNLVGIKSIDAVNWTLAIEIKLYLLYAIFRSIIIKNASQFILGFGLCSIFFLLSIS
ncbi:acyltransferase family protein [Sodalis glossinidius]|uniref:acyltransferase family protein n=1 Tax=Sodalis glossinidius TaxID=63612 RepID=UPI00130537BD